MPDRLEVQNLGKRVAAKIVLQNISFRAGSGELLVITGPNGAGKTTLLRLIAGLSKKSEGKILWNGALLDRACLSLGYLGHKSMLYETLTVLENMVFFMKLNGKYAPSRLEKVLDRVDLWLYRHELVGVLSRGMQQRLALARTLALEPSLILYDEPFTGLDGEGQALLRTVLQEKRPSSVQLVVTHEKSLLGGLEHQEIRLEKGRLV